MIININPYDTGFDENSNVMKFAALAREVSLKAICFIFISQWIDLKRTPRGRRYGR